MKNKVGIWGLGVVGKSALRYFHQKGSPLEVLDKRAPTHQEDLFLKELGVPFYPQEELLSFLERNDYILASCGIDLRPYNAYAHKWLSELDLFAQECTTPIIAITGSVGKTTVTHLLSQLLKAQGKRIFTGGNIGVGLLDEIEQANQADYVILEVSSFQLERCKVFAPSLAIITNIYANHLDRHGTMDAYIQAKMQIAKYQKKGDRILLPLSLSATLAPQLGNRALNFFSLVPPSLKDSETLHDVHTLYYLHNATLMMNYQTSQRTIYDFKALTVKTYQENILILAAALTLLDCPLASFNTILEAQHVPQHRFEKVTTFNNIDFYNDSKATIPASTLAAIEKLKGRPVILFLGGISKGVDRSTFVHELASKVRFIYCFGKEAEQLHSFCKAANIPSFAAPSLDETVINLSTIFQPNDQILFSPAGASYDLFGNYIERGEHFKKLVHELENVFLTQR